MMGSELHARVMAAALSGQLDGLSSPALHVLAAIAVVARDRTTKTQEARLYFGGWDWLAGAALNRQPPYDDHAAQLAVGRAIRELVDRGLIKRRGRIAGQQSTAVYELTI